MHVHDNIEAVRIEENPDGEGWILHLEGESSLVLEIGLSPIMAEELDGALVGFREWRAEREARALAHRRNIINGNCPVWVVPDYGEGEPGPCVLASGHEGDHRTASGAVA